MVGVLVFQLLLKEIYVFCELQQKSFQPTSSNICGSWVAEFECIGDKVIILIMPFVYYID